MFIDAASKEKGKSIYFRLERKQNKYSNNFQSIKMSTIAKLI